MKVDAIWAKEGKKGKKGGKKGSEKGKTGKGKGSWSKDGGKKGGKGGKTGDKSTGKKGKGTALLCHNARLVTLPKSVGLPNEYNKLQQMMEVMSRRLYFDYVDAEPRPFE